MPARCRGAHREHDDIPMTDGTPIWVVIAAYNEASVIARVVGDVAQRGYNVVVVDDGSSDATAERGAAVAAIPRTA